tara:strand:- start:22473 stop:23579 length:1107 start_codon:yes stop_codon:yes gene_type:complete
MKFLKIIFSISLLPEKKKILLFDTNSIEIMYNINEPFNILYTRGEKFYLWPMIKTLLKFNFSLLGYYKEAIYLLDPKLIITTIDNDVIFYNLKKYFKNKIFISHQNGHRTKHRSFFFDLLKEKKNFYEADYCFFFNRNISDLYKKYIKSKNIISGSFRNNNIPIIRKKQKRITFISQFRNETPYYKSIIKNNKFNKDFWTEYNVLPLLNEFCKNNKIKLFVLGCSKKNEYLEKNFYDSILFKENYCFISNKKNQNNYKILDESELVIFIDSTLGYESIGRHNKTVSLSSRSIFKNKKEIFLWPKKNNLVDTPINYTNLKNKKKLFKFIKKNYEQKREKWVYENLFYIRNSMNYVACNQKLKQIIYKNI